MTDDQQQDAQIIEFSPQDVEDLEAIGVTTGDVPNFHPILHVMKEVMAPARGELNKKVTPQWATRMVSSYAGVDFADMNDFRDQFYGLFIELEDILLAEIATDEQCLKWETPEEDRENNAQHYRNLLRDWQLVFLRHELEWDCAAPGAGVKIAVLSEVHKGIFGQTGLTAFLNNIGFEITEQEQAEIADALEALRIEVNGE